MLDQRGQLLRVALGFVGLSRPSYDRPIWALRTWLDSWPGIGHVAVGMHRQGFDVQLTRYDDLGWRATFFTIGMEHSPTSATSTAWEPTPWRARAESGFVSCYTPGLHDIHALRISEEAIMRKALLLIGVALAGAAAGAVGATYVSAQSPAQVTRTELLRKPITGIEGKEVIVFVADVPPGAVAGRHAHPGDEAIYMLQGALRFQPDGEQPFEVKAGQITFNPAKRVHMAKSESSSETAKVLNCMLAEKGQPLTLPAN